MLLAPVAHIVCCVSWPAVFYRVDESYSKPAVPSLCGRSNLCRAGACQAAAAAAEAACGRQRCAASVSFGKDACVLLLCMRASVLTQELQSRNAKEGSCVLVCARVCQWMCPCLSRSVVLEGQGCREYGLLVEVWVFGLVHQSFMISTTLRGSSSGLKLGAAGWFWCALCRAGMFRNRDAACHPS